MDRAPRDGASAMCCSALPLGGGSVGSRGSTPFFVEWREGSYEQIVVLPDHGRDHRPSYF